MQLVDDSMTNRLVAQHYLQGIGLLVETADSSQAAVALASSRSCDTVLVDLQMPDMDGCVVEKAILAQGWGASAHHCADSCLHARWHRAGSRSRHGRLPGQADRYGAARCSPYAMLAGMG